MSSTIVIPAKAGIQLEYPQAKLDSDFPRGDEVGGGLGAGLRELKDPALIEQTSDGCGLADGLQWVLNGRRSLPLS